MTSAHPAPVGTVGAPRTSHNAKLESLPRPKFTLDMTESQWQFTKMQWRAYIEQTPASETQKVEQLRAACDTNLLQRVYDSGSFDSLNTTDLLLAKMKELSVKKVHKTIHMVHMWKMIQEPSEGVRAFVARITGKADLCEMQVKCPTQGCDTKVCYRDEVVLQVLLQGMSDKDLRARTLTQTAQGNLKKLSDVVEYVAAEEAGILQSLNICHESAGIGGIRRSSYKQQDKIRKCGYCGENSHGDKNTAKDREGSCKAWNVTCSKCQKLHHLAKVCKSSKTAASTTTESRDLEVANANAIDVNGYLGALSTTPTKHSEIAPILAHIRRASSAPVTTLPLPHHVHSVAQGWQQSNPSSAPALSVSVALDRAAYGSLSLPPPRLKQRPKAGRAFHQKSVADTGAQIVVVPLSLLHNLAIDESSIFPISTAIKAVNAAPVDIIGGVLLKFTATNQRTGHSRTTRQLAYVSRTVPAIYLSREACADIGVISRNFPQVDEFTYPVSASSITEDNTGETAVHCETYSLPKCSNTGVVRQGEQSCRCPIRELPPTTPPTLPCAPTEENLPQLRQYILERYKSSAFNCCEHQVLPLITGSPPLRLHLDPQATPTAVHTPSAIPRHWVEDVKAGLDRDERLGVIERVPVNEPVTWVSRMLNPAKSDGSPRRVIDYQQVNMHTPRQTHHTRSPWAIASSIPAGTYKSVLDCSNGYHSVPIHPADRHITTFLTPWGRYRYRTTPQGLKSSGDGYTQRSDIVMEGIKDMDRCVDDSILWSNSIKENFFKVCDFLTTCSNAGMVFNPGKFQFSQQEVNYVGFKITNTGVKPQEQFLQNIRDFPTPRNITDVRSWFGMINQISYSYATAPAMAPFRHLLSSKVPFYWSEELSAAFEQSKEEIINQCMKGVRSFSLTAPTALATDWSRLATGFWLTQKFCDCPDPAKPGCCKTGWQTVYCGSSFNTPAESRFHPIEGEACAVKKGLEKCKGFLLGHPNLIVCIDHKPLLAIMGDQELAEIPNPRLLDFKIKSLAFRFKPVYVPGKLHVTPDALSRRSDSPITRLPPVTTHSNTQPMENNVQPQYCESFGPPDWVSTTTAAAQLDIHKEDCSPQEDTTDCDDLENLLHGRVIAHISAIGHTDEVESLTWERLEGACLACPQYRLLHATVTQGAPEASKDWDLRLQPYFRHRDTLNTLGPVVLQYDRPVIPRALRQEVMQHLHAAHGCANMMFARAAASLYWPNYREDINKFQAACKVCRRIAPSNPSLPPTAQPDLPTYPFESVVADFFSLEGRNYLAFADRYSNWLSVMKLDKDDASHLIQALRDYSTYFGIPRRLSSDGASIFTSAQTEEFCKRWGIEQRISSAYHPRSNLRAELAVKSSKRMVRENLKPDGSLDGDKFSRALLIHRNTPDPATGVSPATIIFGRQLRDHLPTPLHKFHLRSDWEKAAKLREECFVKRHYAKCEDLSNKTRQLPRLIPGDEVYIQDQDGKTPRQWNKSGKVLEVLPHDSYLVRVDGSYRTTKRNRKFLRKYSPFNSNLRETPPNPIKPDIPIPIPNINLPLLPDAPVKTTPLPSPPPKNDILQPTTDAGDNQGEGSKNVDDSIEENEVNVENNTKEPDVAEETENSKVSDEESTIKQNRVGDLKMTLKRKPLKEKWIIAPPHDLKTHQDQSAKAIISVLQACLDILNLSQSSTKGGGIART